MAFGAGYASQKDFDDKIGYTYFFSLGRQLDKNTTLQSLKDSKRLKVYSNQNHVNHLDDKNIPHFSINSISKFY